ncbi:Mur ligase domain-containing protein [Tatumella ptyseos]|uniref:UDP-N-acetylmuramate:L-alanyl-gamma-D-glutamyl-meso-diaminopimelate ligase n=1 Tax=Tatumella ptyseos TaxID=82987 RepID=A0A2X5SN44_9GAMM|nr:Mur ligase domain-containing protein [Tatumella ptyseos]SQK76854.1 UDP-N-acetylmuramate:L-alanyl-gamma-D-glutamyl-meso-diaminopimelate ligase [Tatumella ptyseos]
MRIHILGICGTFMGGLAILARALGHEVTGSDNNVYPPMSTLLEQQGIELTQGYDPEQLEPAPDLVIIGNAMARGNPCVEAVLEKIFRISPVLNGCTILCCGTAGFWRLLAPTAKRPPQVWWHGSWKLPG